MREINMGNSQYKFRAWDGNGFGYVVLSPRTVSVPTVDIWKRAWYDADNISFENLEVWQQYTGLKDKNGVNIYEGDLVLVKGARICEVMFHEEAGCWDLVPRNILSSLPIGAVSPSSYVYHTEVIGNIYENPELLENSHARP